MTERNKALLEWEADADPLKQFRRWLEEAVAANLVQPFGMALATASTDGKPSARMVLLRGFDTRGLAFFSNYTSRKAEEIARNPHAALVFYWGELDRQVRVEGAVERLSEQESDEYFRTRPRGSQLGALVSPQSQIIGNRDFLDHRMAELSRKYEDGPIPRPTSWGGYRVVPSSFEFWQGRDNRLHDRLRYRRLDDGGWLLERLAP